MIALQGADDLVVSRHGVRAWREETPHQHHLMPVGHFFHIA